MAIKGLEYEATELFFDGVRTVDENNCVSLRSIALSLNRIADALHHEASGIGIATVLGDK